MFSIFVFANDKQIINIGIVSIRPIEENQKIWLPLEKQLETFAPQYDFNITSYKQPELIKLVEQGKLDFAIVHPRLFVEMETKYGVVGVASVVQKDHLTNQKLTHYGCLIATLNTNKNINTLKDVKGKTIATLRKEAFAVYLVPQDTLMNAGVDMEQDCKIIFTEKSQDDILKAMKNGTADIGFFRSGFIEKSIQEGKIKDGELKVLNGHKEEDYPYLVSTPLFPEWAVVAGANVNQNTIKTVATALYQIESNSIDYNEFSMPLSYRTTRELMQKYHIYPFEQTFGIEEVFEKYSKYLLLFFVIFAFGGTLAAFYFFRAMHRAKRQAKQIETILATSGDGIHVLNAKGDLILFSDSFASMLGHTREEMQTLKVFDFDKHLKTFVIEDIVGNHSGEVIILETKHTKKDGSEIDIELFAKGVLIDDASFLFASSRDITERKIANNELNRLNTELESRVQEELAKNRAKDVVLIKQSRLAAIGEMIGNIAHQWRQPLSALALKIQDIPLALKFNELDSAYADNFKTDSMQLIQYMSQTIEDFRNFFKPDKEKVAFGINESINRAYALEKETLKFGLIDIELSLSSEDIFVNGYPNEFAQVILNILNNAFDAFKATTQSDKKIEIKVTQSSDLVVITIQDNAGGIPADIIDKIFEPYFTTKHQSQGTGIGLYMSKMIIEQNMSGKIYVMNKLDGACFTIELVQNL